MSTHSGSNSDRVRRWRQVVAPLADRIDPAKEFDDLQTALSLGEGRHEKGPLISAAEQAAGFRQRAIDLYVATSLVWNDVRSETDQELAEWRFEIRKGMKTKTPTNTQIEDEVRIRYADAYIRTMRLRAEVEIAVEKARELKDAWRDRENTLKRLVAARDGY